MADNVNHPSHYTSDPSGVECIEITRHRNFNVGNAIKYLWRAGLKGEDSTVQDLEKAIWYIRDEIGRLNLASVGDGSDDSDDSDFPHDPLEPCKTCSHESCGSRCGNCEDCDRATDGSYPGWEEKTPVLPKHKGPECTSCRHSLANIWKEPCSVCQLQSPSLPSHWEARK